MRRLLLALITSAWIALLGALVLPLPLALIADGVGSAAMTPLFYGAWAAAALWMHRLGPVLRMGYVALAVGAALTFVIPLFSLWPPLDRITLSIGIGALLFAALQWFVAQRLRALSRKNR